MADNFTADFLSCEAPGGLEDDAAVGYTPLGGDLFAEFGNACGVPCLGFGPAQRVADGRLVGVHNERAAGLRHALVDVIVRARVIVCYALGAFAAEVGVCRVDVHSGDGVGVVASW
jgi:hypothetical protein